MGDKGLSDEAAAAACKDGDPVTKVRFLLVHVEDELLPDAVRNRERPLVSASIIGQQLVKS